MQKWPAARLEELPPYLFVEIDRKKREAIDAGKDVINLGIGDPDQPTPGFIVDEMGRQIHNWIHHRYPNGRGTDEFVEAAIGFLKRRFGVEIDRTQLTALIGSKEGIGHLPLAVVNPGDVVLVPEPGYPVYTSATIFAGGIAHVVPLRGENKWLLDFDAIPGEITKKAKLLFLNYPNNPTGAVANLDFFKRAVEFARKHEILIAHDAAYTEVYLDSQPPSILQVEGAAEYAIEFHSLSKSFNMTGWRIGFAAGNAEAVGALAKVKDNLDSGQFNAIQCAGAYALDHNDHEDVRAMGDLYRERRDLVTDALTNISDSQGRCPFEFSPPKASFYVWCKCPDGYSSMDVTTKILESVAVVVIPGQGFGESGEGYFRISLTTETRRLREAMERIKSVSW